MCGRYMLAELSWADYFAGLSILRSNAPAEPRYNVRPTQIMPIVRAEEWTHREVRARWGLNPVWNPKHLLINARLATAATARPFNTAFPQQRCLVPAPGWYEWTGTKGAKQPHALTRRPAPFFFAGLWFSLNSLEAAFVILTRGAAPAVAALLNRMPVIVPEGGEAAWLTAPDIDSLGSGDEAEFSTWPVAAFGIRDEGPSLIARGGSLF